LEHHELIEFMEHAGKDPARLIFEDELTGIHNRRFLGNYFEHKISWDRLDEEPVSLVMLDLDQLKDINDTHGHGAGDEALIHVANMLLEVTGEAYIAIRYAGDEFMVLMPDADKETALALAEAVIEKLRATPCASRAAEKNLTLTVSVGVATAPQDASDSESLVQRADAALYYSKRSGKDCLTDAAKADPDVLAFQTAMQALLRGPVAGRKDQLAAVVDTFMTFLESRTSMFVLVEGTPGLGKSTFLQLVMRTLSPSGLQQIRVAGSAPELFRPYYLVTKVLISLLRRHVDKGAGFLSTLSPEQRAALARILPGMEEAPTPAGEDEVASRLLVFDTLVHCISNLFDLEPAIILIDDAHLCDEASLQFFRVLMGREEIQVFICGATEEEASLEETPMWRFHAALGESLDIRRVRLTPLSTADVTELIGQVFPSLEAPQDLAADLAHAAQGNPLFVSEILQQMVNDHSVHREEGRWVVTPLEQGYLPRSLEEMVQRKVESLDAEGRKLLHRATTFGTRVSLSMLAGSSRQMEARVLEFLDAAATQGLLKTRYLADDDEICILDAGVSGIVYDNIKPAERRKLHQDIGEYQEALRAAGTPASAASLVYHFEKSGRHRKARAYDSIRVRSGALLYDAGEAEHYGGDEVEEFPPYPSENVAHLPALISSLLAAVHNARLYPAGSRPVVDALGKLAETARAATADCDGVTLRFEGRQLLVNGEPLESGDLKVPAERLFNLMDPLDLRSIGIAASVTGEELGHLVQALCRVESADVDEGFWERLAADHDLAKVRLKQVRYKKIVDGSAPDGPSPRAAQAMRAFQRGAARGVAELDAAGLAQAAEVGRHFVAAGTKLKLYPAEGTVATRAVLHLREALEEFFHACPYLTFARVRSTLMVNGVRAETADYRNLTRHLLELLEEAGLKSITFLPNLSTEDVVVFFATLEELGGTPAGCEWWWKAAAERDIRGMVFDKTVYEVTQIGTSIGVAHWSERGAAPRAGGGAHAGGTRGWAPPTVSETLSYPTVAPSLLEPLADEEPELLQEAGEEPEVLPAPEPQVVPATGELDLEALPERLRGLFLRGEGEQVAGVAARLFADYASADGERRAGLIRAWRMMLESADFALRPSFVRNATEPFLAAFAVEDAPWRFDAMAALLLEVTGDLVKIGEHDLAAWILGHLARRRKELAKAPGDNTRMLLESLDRELDPDAQKLLAADLVTGDPARQQRALQLLGGFGPGIEGLLVEVIRRSDDLRARQIAASWLAKLGDAGVGRLREELLECSSAPEAVRILEVIDSVTRDLSGELVHVLGDTNPKIRQAAYSLAERLGGEAVTKVVMEYVRNQDPDLAVPAIRYLGRGRIAPAAGVLVELITTSRDERVVVACCKALGRIGDPAAVPALAATIERRGWRVWKRDHPPQARAAAALALARIASPLARETLARHTDDPDPRVREAARSRRPPTGNSNH